MPRPRAPPGSAGSGPGGQQLQAGGGRLAGGDQQQRELLQRPRPAVIATQPRPSRICPAWTGLLTRGHGGLTVTSGRWAGPVLLIVMYESQTWRVRPGASFTFGRDRGCSAVLPVTFSRPAVRGAESTEGASVAKIGSRCLTTPVSPPIIWQKPRSSPHTPPLVPLST